VSFRFIDRLIALPFRVEGREFHIGTDLPE